MSNIDYFIVVCYLGKIKAFHHSIHAQAFGTFGFPFGGQTQLLCEEKKNQRNGDKAKKTNRNNKNELKN